MNEATYGTLYYTDTDSFVLSKKLPDEMVGDKLGQLKLEYVIEGATFLAPKVYGFNTVTGESIVKVKGISKDVVEKNIDTSDLTKLLVEKSKLEVSQEKWYKTCLQVKLT